MVLQVWSGPGHVIQSLCYEKWSSVNVSVKHSPISRDICSWRNGVDSRLSALLACGPLFHLLRDSCFVWLLFISLHMWETICDAWACWSGWNFGPNSTVYPYSELGTEYPPPMKIVRESKSESFRIPPNENCHRVQIQEFQNPPKWKLSQSPNPRVSEYPPQMKIVTESKSESFRIPPNENCHRVQIREFQNTPLKLKLSQSPNLRVSEYPPNENCHRVQIREFQNTPLKLKLSQSPNLRVSEYPLPNENCHRVQMWEFQNTPQMKIVTESKSESFRIPPPKMKIVTESRSESFRIPHPPPLNRKNFRFQSSE